MFYSIDTENIHVRIKIRPRGYKTLFMTTQLIAKFQLLIKTKKLEKLRLLSQRGALNGPMLDNVCRRKYFLLHVIYLSQPFVEDIFNN